MLNKLLKKTVLIVFFCLLLFLVFFFDSLNVRQAYFKFSLKDNKDIITGFVYTSKNNLIPLLTTLKKNLDIFYADMKPYNSNLHDLNYSQDSVKVHREFYNLFYLTNQAIVENNNLNLPKVSNCENSDINDFDICSYTLPQNYQFLKHGNEYMITRLNPQKISIDKQSYILDASKIILLLHILQNFKIDSFMLKINHIVVNKQAENSSQKFSLYTNNASQPYFFLKNNIAIMVNNFQLVFPYKPSLIMPLAVFFSYYTKRNIAFTEDSKNNQKENDTKPKDFNVKDVNFASIFNETPTFVSIYP